MEYGHSIPLAGDWLKLTYIENPNMAFGLEVGGKVFLSVFAIIASIALLYYLYRNRHAALRFRMALGLILAGALGNLIDRIFYAVAYGSGGFFDGNVVDFIDLDLFVVHLGSSMFKFWPIFNVADVAVSAGVVLLLLTGFPQAGQPQEAGTEVPDVPGGNQDAGHQSATGTG
jgi:signal peptidase II